MNKAKKSALNLTYQQFMKAGFRSEGLSSLQKIVVKDVAGYGTASDEKIKGIPEMKVLMQNQKKQTKGMQLTWKTKPFSQYITEDENTAVFAEDVYLTIKAEKELIKMYLRFSVVLNYIKEQWKVIHWHGSKPEQVQSDEDTYGIDKLKQKNAELEKLVTEKTADLTEKNRELEIETALEKVRSVAMGMKKPEDMLLICKTISQQLAKLGVKEIRNVQTAIFYESRGVYMNYEFYAKHDKTFITETSYTNHRIHKAFAMKMLKGRGQFYKTHIKGKKVKDWIAYQKTTNVFIDKYLGKASSLNYYWHSLGPVALGISTYEPLTKENSELFLRFLKVFELAYRRYLDIEKANAQAREAQVETALERVRAVAMSMMRSEDLIGIAKVQYKELKKLGFHEIRNSLISIFYDDKNYFDDYDYSDFSGGNITAIPCNKNAVIDRSLKRMKSATDAFTEFIVRDKELREWKSFRRKNGEYEDARLKNAKELYYYFYSIERGGVGLSTFKKLSDDQLAVLKRFRNVFDLAYKRFTDISNAEAQAREAQIEAALERVRSRAMAMHTSNELKEVAKEMRNQLHLLGQKELETCAIHLWDESSEKFEAWAALRSPDNKGKIIESESNFKIKGIKILEENFQHYHDGKKDYVLINDVEKARQFFAALKPVDPKAYAFLSPTIKNKKPRDISAYWSVSDFTGGSLVMVTMNPPEENSRALLRRFADVFGLAYRRFSDLQKAEAQTREAQIEISLERVRSRAMAMQSSEELKALIGTLFTELTRLDLALTRCIIWIFDPVTNAAKWWMANVEDPSNPMSFFINYHQHPAYIKFVKEWKNQNIKFVYDLKGKDKVKWDNILFNETELKNLPEAVKNGMKAPDRVLLSASFNNFGGINVASLEPLSDEHFNILLRFAKVFDLTYTRFLDLQKTEAQARESQIQLALERVRARTMAMQKSKELSDTSFLLVNQIRELGINAWGCAFHIYADNEERDYEWFSNEDGYLPFYKTPRKKYFKAYFEKRNCEEGLFIKEFKGKACATHYDYLMQIPVVGDALRNLIKSGVALPSSQIDHIAYFEYGYLLFITYEHVPEAHPVFKRFAKEFEQTYIRFLDLQKAEAQARESQIQLALERVRAKTMAMQKSDELGEAAVLLFKQIKQLGIETYASGFNIWDKEAKNLVSWMSNPTGEINPPFEMPIESFERHRKIYAAWKKKETYFEEDIKDDALVIHYKFLRSFPLLDDAFKKSEAAGIATPDRQVHNVAFFKQGFLLFITLEPHSEWKDIFIRFASVFEQTYTRFNDLKQAEAQAKEAQIEAALERIRSMVTAMHESNELLDIVVKMRTEFVALGHDAHYFWHMKWTPEKYLKAMTSGDGSRIGMVMELPRKIHAEIKQIADWEKSKEPAVVFVMNVKETLDYVHKMATWGDFERVDPNMPSEEDIHHIGGLTFIMARTQHGEIGYSLPGMVPQPPQDAINTLIRFAAVFDLAYRRFEDLKTSEKQNRETQIELALEKVRSRSMSMQKSEELREVIRIVYEQLIHLNIHVEHAGFLIDYKKRDDMLHIWLADEHLAPSEVIFPWFDCPPNNAIREAKEKGEEFFFYHLNFEEKNKFYRGLFKLIPGIPEETVDYYFKCPGLAGSGVLLESIGLYIENFSGTVYTEDENAVLMRFGKVFQQTYTRFLDLQKAEAQAREAQIEAALERVRARTMAMQKSSELNPTADLLFEQLRHLGAELQGVAFAICDRNSNIVQKWTSIGVFSFPYTIEPAEQNMYEAWKNKIPLYEEVFEGERIKKYYETLMEVPAFKQGLQQLLDAGIPIPTWQKNHAVSFQQGYLLIITTKPFSETQIFIRFGKVFEQTYTRFLDLQKAEAQAKEAQIEAALERVRARTMAMHKSVEVTGIAVSLNEELLKLGFEGGSTIIIMNKQSGDMEQWTGFSADKNLQSCLIPYFKHPFHDAQLDTWKKGEKFLEYTLSGKEKKLFDDHYFATGYANFPESDKQWMRAIETVTFSHAFMKYGAIHWGPHHLTEEQQKILHRFAKVFEQSYTRFLDLQKAEAQAREAQIEAALERVRSRSMAMHKSEELLEVISVISNQLQQLEIRFGFVCFGIIHPQGNLDFWMAAPGLGKPEKIHMPFVNNPITNSLLDAHKKGTRVLTDFFPKEVMLEWSKVFIENNPDSQIMTQSKEYIQESPGLVRTSVILKEIDVFAGKFAAKPFTDEQNEIIVRFANVFEQSYIRFLDLQKAEMQAREAKIEVSLEKVRTVALILKKSDEMLDVVQALYEALYDLGFTNIRNCIIDVHNPQKETFLDYDYSPQLGRSITEMSYYDSPFIENQVRKTESDNDAFFELILEGQELQDLIDMRLKNGEAEDPRLRQIKQLTYNLYSFGNGAIGISNFGLLSDEQKGILKRFRNVFAFAYKRYSDMVQAEAQAREAQIEAALEKVRSRTLAMQKSDELAETAAVLFQQLITLGIAPNRLFIIIMKAGSTDLEAWVTDEDGSKVSIGFTTNYQNNPSIKKMYEGWQQQKKSLVIDMQGEELQQYFHYLHDELKVPFKGGLEQKRRIQHLAYFSHGLIGMASPDEQPADTMLLLERFAAVFNLTFTRFNDLKIAEAHAIQAEQDLIAIKEAKQKAEEALTELQSTQKQLIQSEKMASLGELTAGIAHEIQNPLNFVNNFSEVSKELLDEMRDAMEKGDTEDAKEIMNDVIQNLEKINYHGKRADGIVKGMLQHSRSSTGQKELTDVNALCDEYLRLSYHGLRAKDKSFNAKFETDFDNSIGKISVVPQEIGRVVLNLINNAFYAVSERKKLNEQGYEPTVIVSTIKETDAIKIKVKDNGTGIPQKVLDKIFQPFFTTKPTGQGTGLGLSLSYDIVRAHGGEIRVETKEGEGTGFIIRLPV